MDLKEVKEKLEFVTAELDTNKKLKSWIIDDDDCFGRGFLKAPDDRLCRECTAMLRLENKFYQVRELCEKLCNERYGVDGDSDVKEKPKSTLQTKLEQLKALREREVSNG